MAKFVNRWGVDWVLDCLRFDLHIKRLIRMRKELERKGLDEDRIKAQLEMRCKYVWRDDLWISKEEVKWQS